LRLTGLDVANASLSMKPRPARAMGASAWQKIEKIFVDRRCIRRAGRAAHPRRPLAGVFVGDPSANLDGARLRCAAAYPGSSGGARSQRAIQLCAQRARCDRRADLLALTLIAFQANRADTRSGSGSVGVPMVLAARIGYMRARDALKLRWGAFVGLSDRFARRPAYRLAAAREQHRRKSALQHCDASVVGGDRLDVRVYHGRKALTTSRNGACRAAVLAAG